ncbi:FAD-dependent oxidoreductase [Streptomyces lasalocidi]
MSSAAEHRRLTAAFRLEQAGCRVRVLESQPPERLGGRMATVARDGFHIDLGAPCSLAATGAC